MRASLILLAACHLSASGVPDGSPGSEGAPPCFGDSLIKVCPTKINGLLTLGSVNTDTDARCDNVGQPAGPEVCVIAAADIMIGDAVATGSRPLVLVAVSAIDVQGVLDVSSHVGGVGAGADFAACAAGPGGNDTLGGGGGAGGSFTGAGGNGANGGGGVAGGTATPGQNMLVGVRGGCAGARGGNATPTDAGGDSGGAVYLIAGTFITVSGGIYAGGAGGQGGLAHNGGYGGGSGGLIGLEAQGINLAGSASVAANGGGGGEGGSTQAGTNGNPGHDGSHDSTLAVGGTGATSSGGDGGDGAAGTTSAMAGLNGNGSGAGGGGGGGSAGIVWVTATPMGGTISPPPEMH
jgi:hypothetical protein